MTTGTPRQAFLKSQGSAEGGKAWMSFEESPVHSAVNPPNIPNKDERWTSFANSSGALVDPTGSGIVSSPAPANYSVSKFPKNQPRKNDDTVLKHPGVGYDSSQSVQGIKSPAHHSNTHLKIQHSVAQPSTVTHGPGSTMIHILRHTSTENDHENQVAIENNSNHAPSTSTNIQGDTTTDLHSMKMNLSQKKSLPEVHQAFQKQPSGDAHYATEGRDDENVTPDPWLVTEEQGIYYRHQFQTMQKNLVGKIDGQTARNFFTKSRLPIPELSHIWELCDMDQDGHLTLLEFCAAFHLVVARKNGFELPAILPKSLLPPLVSMCNMGKKKVEVRPLIDITEDDKEKPVTQSQSTEKTSSSTQQPTIVAERLSESSDPQSAPVDNNTKNHWNTHQNKWETFSDRTLSSTNLANFDQGLDHTDNSGIVQPVPLRITPSRHESHSAKMRHVKLPPKSTDDEEHHPPGLTVPQSHKSLTNPYGSLKNDFSEADSHTSPRARSMSNSSHSSAGTSDRSLSEIEGGFKPPPGNSSDQSDWSSRPLQPRSGSDSSIESVSLEASVIASAPTPPPRPNQPLRGSNLKTENISEDVPDSSKHVTAAPTPPPRPQQQTTNTKPIKQSEEFADFSQFKEEKPEENSTYQQTTTIPVPVENDKAEFTPKESSKPTPAPRTNRDEKLSRTSDNDSKEEKSPDKLALKKAPTKPPRSRIQSVDSAIHDHIKVKPNSISTASDIPSIQEKPTQEDARKKNSLQQSIRDLKLCNSKLTKLNADLQQELKDVMQSRITVEMSIHQLRPFSQ